MRSSLKTYQNYGFLGILCFTWVSTFIDIDYLIMSKGKNPEGKVASFLPW